MIYQKMSRHQSDVLQQFNEVGLLRVQNEKDQKVYIKRNYWQLEATIVGRKPRHVMLGISIYFLYNYCLSIPAKDGIRRSSAGRQLLFAPFIDTVSFSCFVLAEEDPTSNLVSYTVTINFTLNS